MYDFLRYFTEYFDVFILCLGLTILIVTASAIDKKSKRLVSIIIASVLLLSLVEYLETFFDETEIHYENFWRYLFSTIGYSLRPSILVLFFHIRLEKKRKFYFLLWLPSVINTVIYFLALFAYKNPSMQFIYWYNSENVFQRGVLGWSVYVVSGWYIISFLVFSILDSLHRKERTQVNFIIIFTAVVAIFASFISFYFKMRYSYIIDAFMIGTTFYYIYLCYETAYQTAINHEREMQEKTTALMLSQIQPHFIYNTLATIQVLCDFDAALAGETISDFSKYLRVNTDALSKKEPVPISKEVKHAQSYAKIEMLRFDNVHVIFEIEDKDFDLPVLTIQPMVENAIKYGVRGLQEGIVKVRTFKENKNHILLIEDNGKGFDVNSIGNDGRNHVGVKNVKTRIENMVNGSFSIESEIGKGTKIKITIPEVFK